MYRFSLAVAALFLCWPTEAHAQMQVREIDDPPPLAAYLELGGNALMSGNVDLVIGHTSVRAGGFANVLCDDPDVPLNGVLMVSHLFGTGGHYLETGVGVVAMHRFGFDDRGVTKVGRTATVGYRLQTRRRFVRVGVSLAPPKPDGERGLILGLSFGRTFGG